MERTVLRRRADGRLTVKEGEPFFLLADTAWSGLVRSTIGDWRDYLAIRKEQGFNAVLTVLVTPWRGCGGDSMGEAAIEGGGVNSRYFDRLEEKFVAAREAGMLLMPVLIWSCTARDPGQTWDEDLCCRVSEHAVGRFGEYDILWMLGGDGKYAGSGARWGRIGREVFGSRPEAVVGMHHGGLQFPDEELLREEWCSFHGLQSGHGDGEGDYRWLLETMPKAAWKLSGRAIANVEPNYEHHPAYRSQMMFTGRQVRRAAWWSMLVGPSCGVGYGHNSVWNWNTEAEEAIGHPSITQVVGKLPPWRMSVDLPGARSMGVLRNFFEGLAWTEMQPAGELVVQERGELDQWVAASRSEADGCVVIYRPAHGEFGLSGEALERYGKMQWFNPVEGTWRDEERTVAKPLAPNAGDWVLVLRR